MSSLLMFAFAEEKLAMRVTSTISRLLFDTDSEWITTLVGVFILSLPIWFIVFFFIFKDIRAGLKATVQGLDTVSNNHRMMFKRMGDQIEEAKQTIKILSKSDSMMFIRMGEQLEETKKTNKILSKLVVEKKPNSTDDR